MASAKRRAMLASKPLALLALLPLALATIALAGCDDGDKDIADDEQIEGEQEDEELPGSREGEACDGTPQPCSDADGEIGEELCLPEPWSEEATWSACLVETCTESDAGRECGEEESGVGAQYCFKASSGVMYWGECQIDAECVVGESASCGLEPEFSVTKPCVLDSFGRPFYDSSSCETPLVLSFDGREPAFAAAPAAARAFDISGTNACLSADWPTAATPWLALDRDHNGSIDGGHELFGNGTRLASGRRAEQGFAALRELDSDGDGRITAKDAAWSQLVLWADHDGDRRSSGWELLALEAYGVEAIELDYRTQAECDERGNCGVERAGFTFSQGGVARSGEVIDVYVACGE